jgi:CyaY protein
MQMDKQQFTRLSDACLDRVGKWLEQFDPDELDYKTSDGVVTLEFADGTRYVLNRQAATSQMWFAAGARAWHYDWNEEQQTWIDDRDRHRLLDNIAVVASKKLGRLIARP